MRAGRSPEGPAAVVIAVGPDEAVRFFTNLGEHYKAEIIAGIPADQQISLYGQGDWVDLCRGPQALQAARAIILLPELRCVGQQDFHGQ